MSWVIRSAELDRPSDVLDEFFRTTGNFYTGDIVLAKDDVRRVATYIAQLEKELESVEGAYAAMAQDLL